MATKDGQNTSQAASFVWKDDILGQFTLRLDGLPPQDVTREIIKQSGELSAQGMRKEVPFEKLVAAMRKMDSWSTSSTAQNIQVPIGPAGRGKAQELTLGGGQEAHALLIGRTGSGKTNLMHVIITSLALTYSPKELQLYLIDFKGGVGFKRYAEYQLPHAKVIAIESEREFGMSVLRALDSEFKQRSDKFRAAGVDNLASYRAKAQNEPLMPRIILIVDEFQEFFTENDDGSQQAKLIFERLARQGRSYGVHFLLATQSLAGSINLQLPSSIMGQIKVRIALACSEADSRLILADDNKAARSLTRPGEAIYNSMGGLVEGNNPFQVALFNGETDLHKYLSMVADMAKTQHISATPIIFEGNEASHFEECQSMLSLVGMTNWPEKQDLATAWLGEPVAIRPPVTARFQRQAGRHLLIVAREEQEGLGILYSVWAALLAHHSPASGVRFLVLDYSNPDSDWNGLANTIQEQFDHYIELLNQRTLAEHIPTLSREAIERLKNPSLKTPSIYVIVFGVHRVRDLRPDDSAPFRPGEKPLSELFAQLLRDGPEAGIHVLAWADTLANARRTLDRGIREFGIRVAGAMSVEDSRTFLDEPHAGRLDKPHRVIVLDEDRPGTYDMVRPYGIPDRSWLKHLAEALKSRAANNV